MKAETSHLISPYGVRLIDLLVANDERESVRAYAGTLPSLPVSDRVVCDLELLAVGGFSPLDRFMGKADYERVVGEMRLQGGSVFPMPVTLPVSASDPVKLDAEVTLRDSRNNILAILEVEEIYPWDRRAAAHSVFGTVDLRHPWWRRCTSGATGRSRAACESFSCPLTMTFKRSA